VSLVHMKPPVFSGLLLALLLVGAAAQAHGHGFPPLEPAEALGDVAPEVVPSLLAAPAPPALPWPALLAAIALGLLVASRPRRALALGLALLVTLFLFETGVHSVHHLSARGEAPHCALATASNHLSGVDADAPKDPTPRLEPTGEIALSVESAPADHVVRPGQGRAPPALSAVAL
jgi:hypothetical protein